MNNEKRVKQYLKNIPVEIRPDRDRALRASLVSEASGGPARLAPFSFARAAAFILAAGLFAAACFLAGGYTFTRARDPQWSLDDSVKALRAVESVVIHNASNIDHDAIVHIKGGLLPDSGPKVRCESAGGVLIRTPRHAVSYTKTLAASDDWTLGESAATFANEPAMCPSPDLDYAAMLLPPAGAFDGGTVHIDNVAAQRYYVVTGTFDGTGVRFRTVIDARTSLPVSTARWDPRDDSVVLRSEVLEYNADIPDELFELEQPK